MPKSSPSFGSFFLRHTALPSLSGSFFLRHTALPSLSGSFFLRQTDGLFSY